MALHQVLRTPKLRGKLGRRKSRKRDKVTVVEQSSTSKTCLQDQSMKRTPKKQEINHSSHQDKTQSTQQTSAQFTCDQSTQTEASQLQSIQTQSTQTPPIQGIHTASTES
ncbi:hypothetical protein M9458_031956, partial [Cirrhinus mrigala]